MSELASEPVSQRGGVLVAGVGNLFLSDDDFGPEVVRRLQARGGLPGDVELVETGICGRDLAYRLLDGYRALVIVDTAQRGGAPGTVYTLEHDLDGPRDPAPDATPALGGHSVDPLAMLDLLDELAAATDRERPVGRVLVVGCEPAVLDEGIGLSPAVAAAVDPAATAVTELVIMLTRDQDTVQRSP